jgi:DNA-binding NtrC family response regulator
MAKIHFVGLDPQIADHLKHALPQAVHSIRIHPVGVPVEAMREADLIFASGDDRNYRQLLNEVRKDNPSRPFIVVTRMPEVKAWLDALEAGATDYCAEPIEPKQVQWLLDSAFSKRTAMSAAAA